MQKLIDNLIFPAPRPPGYNESNFPDKLIYIPKKEDYLLFKY